MSDLTLPYTLKMFDREQDFDTLERWWNAHGHGSPPSMEMLPKLGVLAVPLGEYYPEAALFLFMDNSVGVCWVEYPVTRPGLSLKRAREAFAAMLGFLRSEAKQLGYGIIVAYTTYAIARELRKFGFIEDRRDMVHLIAAT